MRTLILAAAASIAMAAPPPVDLVHSEHVRVGPYDVQASFSDWPVKATRSLDFTFVPDGDITGHRATLRLVGPEGAEKAHKLARHPRARDKWGLDVFALPDEGVWQLELTVDGPKGEGRGALALPVGPRPGPPIVASWTVALGPLILGAIALLVVWIRGRRTTARADTWTWS